MHLYGVYPLQNYSNDSQEQFIGFHFWLTMLGTMELRNFTTKYANMYEKVVTFWEVSTGTILLPTTKPVCKGLAFTKSHYVWESNSIFECFLLAQRYRQQQNQFVGAWFLLNHIMSIQTN